MVELLGKLADAEVGCYIQNIFVGALAYADDIVLLAPTARAMRLLLGIRDHYALEYSILFNDKKSKCISFGPCYGYSFPMKNVPAFFIGGSVDEYVDSWPYLGPITSNTDDDKLDLINRCDFLCAQINNGLCYFKSTSIIVKMKQLMSHCSSHYETELWDLYNNSINNMCVTWPKGLR